MEILASLFTKLRAIPQYERQAASVTSTVFEDSKPTEIYAYTCEAKAEKALVAKNGDLFEPGPPAHLLISHKAHLFVCIPPDHTLSITKTFVFEDRSYQLVGWIEGTTAVIKVDGKWWSMRDDQKARPLNGRSSPAKNVAAVLLKTKSWILGAPLFLFFLKKKM